MILFKKASDILSFIENQRSKGAQTGFVPTMGALHQGHISLVGQSKSQTSLCISSIFVNPTQFNNKSDFEKYPITIEKDIEMLEAAGCDLLFLPSLDEIYPHGFKAPFYELGYLETVLEGASRPGHYQGVCQVVDRLLTIIPTDILFLGRKDYQQCMVIEKMINIRGFDTRIIIGDTIREQDGLAMSSRNVRLNSLERKQATGIFKALTYIKNNIQQGDLGKVLEEGKGILTQHGFVTDYLQLTNRELQILETWDGKSEVIALVAAYMGDVRLIDNMKVA